MLAGVGLGGAFFAVTAARIQVSLDWLALTCALEALAIAVPYAAGDRIAVLAILLGPQALTGFTARVMVWTLLAAIVVAPAAVVAGWQYPLLLAASGRGRRNVGRDVGQVAACNTLGGIAGSLAAGFGLLPWLSAPTTWVSVAALLSCMSVVLLLRRRAVAPASSAVAAAVANADPDAPARSWLRRLAWAGSAAAVICLAATGPTAVWRHAPIGAGRAAFADETANAARNWMRAVRRHVVWEADGEEVSLALLDNQGYSLVANGKSEGDAVGERRTAPMLGLVGAALHPQPQRALTVGLGLGCTAGWLASVTAIERVDVVELEPKVAIVASLCAAVNEGALSSPKVRLLCGDAREHLLTTGDRYDLIVSEPSNPYRSGIANLFTREFYRAGARRLQPGGLFLQWVQIYEVDLATVATVYATLRAVFPCVETWHMGSGDLLLVCGETPPRHDVAALRTRLAAEPFRTALPAAWQTVDLEGFYAHFIGDTRLADKFIENYFPRGGRLNTDDDPVIEYGYSRTLGLRGGVPAIALVAAARANSALAPRWENGQPDAAAMREDMLLGFLEDSEESLQHLGLSADEQSRLAAVSLRNNGRFREALDTWGRQADRLRRPTQILALAESLADAGQVESLRLLEWLPGDHWQTEARAIAARLAWRVGDASAAVRLCGDVFTKCHEWPWLNRGPLDRLMRLSVDMVTKHPAAAPGLELLVSKPFCVHLLNDQRLELRVRLASQVGPACLAAVFRQIEPHVPWVEPVLAQRLAAYRAVGDPLQAMAEAELDLCRRQVGVPVSVW